MLELHIDSNGESSLEDYNDSRFDRELMGSDQCRVTRRRWILEFDKPCEIDSSKISKFEIDSDGLSNLEHYKDSWFEYEYHGIYKVTRRHLTEEKQRAFVLKRLAKTCFDELATAFHCKALIT